MAPTQLSIVKRQLKETQDELHRIKKQKKTDTRAALAKAPQISELLVPLLVGIPPETTLITIHGGLLPPLTKNYLDLRRDNKYGVFHLLEDQNPESVNLYRLYAYTGKVYSTTTKDRDGLDASLNEDREWATLVNLYFFGSTIRDERFVNRVVDAFIDKVEEDQEEQNYRTGLSNEVYSNTAWGNKLRKLYVDLHVWVGKGKGIIEPNDDAHGPGGFLRNVITAQSEAGGGPHDEETWAPWEVNACKHYHKHVDTPLCVEEDAEVT